MRPGTQTLIRLILLTLWLELSLLGATFNGILLHDFQPLTLAMIGGGLVLWLAWHARTRRPWHTTALDLVIVGWWLVFALSIFANGETWRRSAEALWYMGLYTLVFLVLTDLISQGMPRRTLSFIMLIAGGLHVSIGALQTVTLLQTGGFDALRRPVGLIGNPNAYGALLLALLPLALSEVLAARQTLMRGVWFIYSLAIAVLLFFSASRGAWTGAAIGLIVYGGLVLRYYELTSWGSVQAAWARLSRGMQAFAVIIALTMIVGVSGAGVFFVRSLSDQTRSADLRTYGFQLCVGSDANKDQSYFLFNLNQAQLSRTCFPVGHLTKAEVRHIGDAFGLSTAQKKESQEICFVPGNDYKAFIDSRIDASKVKLGFVTTLDGKVLCRHEGIHHFTVGQRKGLAQPLQAAQRAGVDINDLYVVDIDASSGTVYLGTANALLKASAHVKDVNWIGEDYPTTERSVQVKIRYRTEAVPAKLRVESATSVVLELEVPQRAITPGQAAVFF